ncbi:hypothetical protein ASG43_06915 [Aureimonas sp. Leaf454]|uniref:PIG-L deacetylase family protein n=1 Tax=Aureimonas sp. Leaf454 TaxID=1736381 RepID=UPI0006F8B677|nr:PIG-L family deacetylase [Aureimonas sp. Leaf454]KQT50972.1 hypothetical protein ASG43_06915 [Aureimonas sp. Leaf454]
MRLGDWRERVAASPIVSVETAIGPGGLVVIAPHPDDECLGASALIAGAVRLGRPVGLVALTDGEASHRSSDTWPARRLAALRVTEQAAAMQALGAGGAEVLRLGLPDSGAEWHPRLETSAAAVAALCDRLGATTLAGTVLFDPHTDHRAAGLLLEAVGELRPALRLLAYDVWTVRLDADEEVDAEGLEPMRLATPRPQKRAAVACHRSQLGLVVDDDPDGFTLPRWFLDHHDGETEAVYRLR